MEEYSVDRTRVYMQIGKRFGYDKLLNGLVATAKATSPDFLEASENIKKFKRPTVCALGSTGNYSAALKYVASCQNVSEYYVRDRAMLYSQIIHNRLCKKYAVEPIEIKYTSEMPVKSDCGYSYGYNEDQGAIIIRVDPKKQLSMGVLLYATINSTLCYIVDNYAKNYDEKKNKISSLMAFAVASKIENVLIRQDRNSVDDGLIRGFKDKSASALFTDLYAYEYAMRELSEHGHFYGHIKECFERSEEAYCGELSDHIGVDSLMYEVEQLSTVGSKPVMQQSGYELAYFLYALADLSGVDFYNYYGANIKNEKTLNDYCNDLFDSRTERKADMYGYDEYYGEFGESDDPYNQGDPDDMYLDDDFQDVLYGYENDDSQDVSFEYAEWLKRYKKQIGAVDGLDSFCTDERGWSGDQIGIPKFPRLRNIYSAIKENRDRTYGKYSPSEQGGNE